MPSTQTRESRNLSQVKANKVQFGNGTPPNSEGAEGEITIRLVDGAVKLYAKFRGKWFGISLS